MLDLDLVLQRHLDQDEDEALEREAIQRQEEALEVGPARYVYEDDDRQLQVHLHIDPDGYWGGVPRDWTLTVAPMRSFYTLPLAELGKRCRGETSGWIKKKLAAFAQGVLVGPKEILTASSVDGERTFRFSQLRGFIP
jgi:hypothetical protein